MNPKNVFVILFALIVAGNYGYSQQPLKPSQQNQPKAASKFNPKLSEGSYVLDLENGIRVLTGKVIGKVNQRGEFEPLNEPAVAKIVCIALEDPENKRPVFMYSEQSTDVIPVLKKCVRFDITYDEKTRSFEVKGIDAEADLIYRHKIHTVKPPAGDKTVPAVPSVPAKQKPITPKPPLI